MNLIMTSLRRHWNNGWKWESPSYPQVDLISATELLQFSPIHWLSIMFIHVPSFSHLFLNKLYWLGINLGGYTPLLSPWPKHDIGKSAVMIRMRRPLGADSVWKHVSDMVYTPRLRPFGHDMPWQQDIEIHKRPYVLNICSSSLWKDELPVLTA